MVNPFPEKKYAVIYADPPWGYRNRGTRARIEALMGDVPRIELFARERAPGWDVWGDEV